MHIFLLMKKLALNVPFAQWTIQSISEDTRHSKKPPERFYQPRLDQHTQPETKTYAETINNQNTSFEHIFGNFSKFFSNLNALIIPLITLLSSVLNALII